MINRNIYKIEKVEGNNNFVFLYVDANGKTQQEKKTIEEFLLLHPLVVEKEKRISDLEKNNTLLIENKGLLDEKVIRQSVELAELNKEKEEI